MSPKDRGLLVKATPPTEGAASDVAVRSVAPSTSADTQVGLDRVVKDYIVGRWGAYVSNGWELFRQGKYLQAFEMFKLASSMTLDDPQQSADVKVAEVIGGVAAGQYATASAALRWLLSDDPRTGQTRCPDLLTRMMVIESSYGNKQDFVEHVRALEHVAMSKDNTADTQALRAVVLWGKKDRVGAMFYGKSLTERAVPLPWSKLPELMNSANESLPRQASPVPTTAPAISSFSLGSSAIGK